MTDTRKRMSGKVALVTGAARGQGRSHAVRLAEEGADVIALDACVDLASVPYALATEADLQETAELIRSTGQRAHVAKADVRDLAELSTAIADGVAALGRLDIVSANAGIMSMSSLAEMDESQWLEMIDVNLNGVWRTCRASIGHVIAGGRGGSIVLTSSVAGLKSYPNAGHYVTAKHGVVGMMKTLAQEHAGDRIRVNCVNPTQVNTDMIHNDLMYSLFCPDRENPTREDFAAASRATGLLPVDWVESSDVTNALMFLVSDEARFITGVALPIDAGALHA